MKHALIVGDNFLVARAMEQRLRSVGFTSFDIARTDEDCFMAAQRRLPALIAMLDGHDSDVSVDTVREIAELTSAPVLLVTAPAAGPMRRLGEGTSLDGPFSLRELGDALASASRAFLGPRPVAA